MSEKTINISGQDFSEDTIKKALKKYCNFEEKPYQFQAGDVVVFNWRDHDWVRIICKSRSGLEAFDVTGHVTQRGQEGFEQSDYRKVGTISQLFCTTIQ